MYLRSAEYNPQREHTICATDPALAIDWAVVDGIALRPEVVFANETRSGYA